MKRVHVTLSGHQIEYDDEDKATAKLLAKVRRLVDDPKATEDDLVRLIYSPSNPLMAELVPGRGYVTAEVLEHPIYRVLTDLLFRKRVQQKGIDVDALAARYSETVTQAAERVGVTNDAVRKAIYTGRLPSWFRDNQHWLDPRHVDAIEWGSRRRAG